MKLGAFFLFLFASLTAQADDFALRDGDTVAFLGDSITAARKYSRFVEDYTLLRFPERKIRFLNVGHGGETAQGCLARLESDVFSKNITVLTVAYGINDIGWGAKADAAHRQAYLDGLKTIVEKCQQHHVRVFICSAAITAEPSEKAEQGFLQKMCDDGLAQAKTLGAGTIDIMRQLRTVQKRIEAANAKQPDKSKQTSLHEPDGVHLNDLGQTAMGWAMLKGMRAPADVSSAEINLATGKVTSQKGCQIEEIQTRPDGAEFVRLDKHWPLNRQPLWMLAGWHIPLSEDLNRYDLKLIGLAPGRYAIKAGNRPLGVWSDAELTRGVNLASATADGWQPGGPWHAQAQLVTVLTSLRDELERAQEEMRLNLTSHPNQARLLTKTTNLEQQVIALQRELATPVPVKFTLTPQLTRIKLSKDGKTFEKNGQPWRIWGVNYDHDSQKPNSRLLEDYWEAEWDTVVADFQEIKALGANVVRIHLQFGKFMTSPTEANPAALDRLGKLLKLAEETGLYLDITGLGCYHKADTPAWYDSLSENARWDAQAAFWTAIARNSKDSAAVFCYDLMNEPIFDGKTDQGWLGGEFGGKYFVQRLTTTPEKRMPIEIAKAWVEQITKAIRKEDPQPLLTVGCIPWSQIWPGAKPIFNSPEISPLLDFTSIHLYPKSGPEEMSKALHALQVHQIGKPVVIEETFPLSCSEAEMNTFLKDTHNQVSGYLSFYWGQTAAESPPGLVQNWLREFQRVAKEKK